jgi:hypothetical protein
MWPDYPNTPSLALFVHTQMYIFLLKFSTQTHELQVILLHTQIYVDILFCFKGRRKRAAIAIDITESGNLPSYRNVVLWERSDTARNPYFRAHFLNTRFQCSRLFRNCGNIKPLYGRGQEER